MIKKCVGCGVILQDNNVLLDGYTQDIRNDLCRRCFRMRNYGEYEFVTKSNEEYIKILKDVGNKKCLVLYVVDLMNVPKNLNVIREYVKNNKIILILNKRDTLPLSLNDEKIINYFKKYEFDDVIIISANKNYNLDYLMKKISDNRIYQDVYVVGNTNAGKSTLINKLLKDYSLEDNEYITISPMPSTTLNEIKMKINNFYLIDTPGLVDNGNILNYVKEKDIKNISLKKEVKPITYQLRKNQAIIIENYIRLDYLSDNKNSVILFISNNLKVKKINSKKNTTLQDLSHETFDIKGNEDIVINGLGFIKVVDNGKISIYKDQNIEVFTRKTII